MKSTEMLVRRLRADTRLSFEHLSALEAIPIVIKQVPEDTAIVKEGDRPHQCCLLIEGFASRSKVSAAGVKQIVSFHIPGDVPDLQSLFLGVMDHDLTTISPATLGLMQHSVLEALFEKHPAIARAFWRETLIEASIFREWILNLGARPAPQRMAHLLVELRERMAAVGLTESDVFDFPVTQSELGDALGLTPVHVNRVLQEYRARKLLDVRKNKVTIADHDAAVQEAGFDDVYLHLARNDFPS
jgi:CRP-like cAMP-binding protein